MHDHVKEVRGLKIATECSARQLWIRWKLWYGVSVAGTIVDFRSVHGATAGEPQPGCRSFVVGEVVISSQCGE